MTGRKLFDREGRLNPWGGLSRISARHFHEQAEDALGDSLGIIVGVPFMAFLMASLVAS